MRAGVALGSNLGDRLENLRKAKREIAALNKVREPMVASSIYETEPVGCGPGAAKFLNAALEFEYSGEAHNLLRELVQIEKSLGRPAFYERNAPRTIDLDLLYFGELEIETNSLQLPHPRIAQRKFVLKPLADIRPDLVLPKQTSPIRALLAQLNAAAAVVRIEAQW